VLHDHECAVIQIGGFEDHLHLLIGLPRTKSIAQIVDVLKSTSSKWIKGKDAAFNQFHWQSGYGAFSVSESNVDAVVKYILNQHEHHRKTTFQEEYRQFLDRHNIKYDERYMWD
jgi:REP element-mobilizing transposase RayT